MKKLIALLLAVSSLAMSTTVFADTYTTFDVYALGTPLTGDYAEHDGVSRNYTPGSSSGNVTMDGATISNSPNYGSPLFRPTNMGLQYLPTYRSGDKLTFRILCKDENLSTNDKSVYINDGEVLTFICSKQDDSNYNNYTVQYVDQVKLSLDTNTKYVNCTFDLRDNLEDGRYKLEMNLHNKDTGANMSKTYSFLIGTPSVELLYAKDLNGATPTKADKYWLDEFGNAHCFAKATITGGANFSQTGTEFGFIFDRNGDGTIDKSVDGADYSADYTKGTTRDGNNVTADAQYVANTSLGHNSEVHGSSVYFYRMVIEGVTSVDQLPDVDVYLND